MRVEIRRVLMAAWDPIGIKDEPACADEYDRYIDGILQLLMSGSDCRTMANHLAEIVTGPMGMAATPTTMLPTAEALLRIPLRAKPCPS